MSRIRSIHPGLTTDESYMSMSMAAKAAWPLLWTECDDHGVFEWKPIVLKARIFPADDVNFDDILTEWERLGCVQCAEHDGRRYGLVRNFGKFQRPKNPAYRHPFIPEWGEYVGIKCHAGDSDPPALPQSSPSAPVIRPQMKEEGGRKEDIRAVAPATRPRSPDRFEEFWDAYPKRDGANPKAPAAKAFATAVKSGCDPGEIIAGASRYRVSLRSRGQEGTPYVAQAVTWLRQARWGDYPAQAPPADVKIAGFYARDGSAQLDAWDAYMRSQNRKNAPRDRNGGWRFPTEWPPGYQQEAAE